MLEEKRYQGKEAEAPVAGHARNMPRREGGGVMKELCNSRDALMLKTNIDSINVSMWKPRTYTDLVHSKLASEVMTKIPRQVLCGLALEQLIDKGYLRYDYQDGYYHGYKTRRRSEENRRPSVALRWHAELIKDLIETSPNREMTTREICDALDTNPGTARRCLHLLDCESVRPKQSQSAVWRLPITEQEEQ